jgi:protocatechuate 3,4-dioxygenase beta subunit
MISRRKGLILPFLALPTVEAGRHRALAQGGLPLALTPACTDGASLTVAQTEGPYFRAEAPRKRDLAADAPNGEPLLIGGFVQDPRCRPVADALIQLWQADETGAYDRRGFRLRGHQFSDEAGRWWFSTIIPGGYWSRTRHLHVKVQRPNGPVLTTQLYFPDEPRNQRDREFDPRLLMQMAATEQGRMGRFDFVI